MCTDAETLLVRFYEAMIEAEPEATGRLVATSDSAAEDRSADALVGREIAGRRDGVVGLRRVLSAGSVLSGRPPPHRRMPSRRP